MRTVTTAEKALLHDPNSAVYVRVELYTNTGSYLTRLDEFVKECTIKASIDNEVSTCDLLLAQSIDNNSLNLLMTESTYNKTGPLIDLNRIMKVYCAVVGSHTVAQSYDYKLYFEGYIDTINILENKRLDISMRDLGAYLQDRWIETEFSKVAEEDISGEMYAPFYELFQDALSTYLPGIILYSKNGTLATPFTAADNPLDYRIYLLKGEFSAWMTFLKERFESLSWDIRYRFHENTGVYQLVAQEVRRDIEPEDADDYFKRGEYIDVSKVDLNIQNIRNVIQLAYTNPGKKQNNVIVQDNDSITRYGRRWMLLAEPDDSMISVESEALRMANAILKDLATPFVEMEIEIPFNYAVELSDFYTFQADNVHFDVDTSLGVVSYESKFKISEKGEAQSSTTLQLRGKPAGRVARWLNRAANFTSEKIGLRIVDTSTNVAARLGNGDFLQYSRG